MYICIHVWLSSRAKDRHGWVCACPTCIVCLHECLVTKIKGLTYSIHSNIVNVLLQQSAVQINCALPTIIETGYICAHKHIYNHIHTDAHKHLQAHTQVYSCVYVYMCMYMYILFSCTCGVYACTYMYSVCIWV